MRGASISGAANRISRSSSYARQLLEQAGHEVLLIDANLSCLALEDIRTKLEEFRPDFTVVTTAPTYVFWRCPPPELRVPMETVIQIRDVAGALVIVGPHSSTTPHAVLKKHKPDVVVLGECEEVLPRLASQNWRHIDGIVYPNEGVSQYRAILKRSTWARSLH